MNNQTPHLKEIRTLVSTLTFAKERLLLSILYGFLSVFGFILCVLIAVLTLVQAFLLGLVFVVIYGIAAKVLLSDS